MKLSELASQFRPFLEHLYNEGEPALKLLIEIQTSNAVSEIHNISIARETVNVVWFDEWGQQDVAYIPIHDVQDKCFPDGNPHVPREPEAKLPKDFTDKISYMLTPKSSERYVAVSDVVSVGLKELWKDDMITKDDVAVFIRQYPEMLTAEDPQKCFDEITEGPPSSKTDYPEEFEEYIKDEDYSDQDAADLFEHIAKRADECETSWHVAFKDHIN